ncbi:MAG: DUF2804 domain-containing protein [Candidatus Niameybacter stercoravium]|nr:DUF2804 domain-containing protein [Candidatus Niameybacter stercoravium]
MQREITKCGKLLNNAGTLRESGYAKSLLLEYNKENIQAHPMRIKEWDYYLISNDRCGIALTLADNAYMGLISVSLLDFTKEKAITTSYMKPFTRGRWDLPRSTMLGDSVYEDQDILMTFLNNGKERRLKCRIKHFKGHKPFECEFLLTEEPKESMVIATPFKEDPLSFYYNQKIVGMKVRGYAKYEGQLYKFSKEDARAILDWGRGVWPYRNTWYWSAGAGQVEGKEFGFNLGYGFGDREAASENMLFYEGKAHKLEKVIFHIPMQQDKEDYMKRWHFTSSDKRFEATFDPILDRKAYTTIGIISSSQHQVFGRFNGTAILDDGKVIEIKNFLGFAEKVKNKW